MSSSQLTFIFPICWEFANHPVIDVHSHFSEGWVQTTTHQMFSWKPNQKAAPQLGDWPKQTTKLITDLAHDHEGADGKVIKHVDLVVAEWYKKQGMGDEFLRGVLTHRLKSECVFVHDIRTMIQCFSRRNLIIPRMILPILLQLNPIKSHHLWMAWSWWWWLMMLWSDFSMRVIKPSKIPRKRLVMSNPDEQKHRFVY